MCNHVFDVFVLMCLLGVHISEGCGLQLTGKIYSQSNVPAQFGQWASRGL